MKLIENWPALFLRLKSNQINLLAALLAGVYAGFDAWVGGSNWKIALALGVFNVAAPIARIIAQPETIADVEQKAAAKKAATQPAPLAQE